MLKKTNQHHPQRFPERNKTFLDIQSMAYKVQKSDFSKKIV